MARFLFNRILPAVGVALMWGGGPAQATLPSDPRDVAVSEALSELDPLQGAWEGVMQNEFRSPVKIYVVRDFGAIYFRQFVSPESQWAPVFTLTYDAIEKKYKLFAPVMGGGQVVDVSHPAPDTLSWVTRPDGWPVRTTLVFSGERLIETEEPIDDDGVVRRVWKTILERKGSAHFDVSVTPSQK